MEFSKSSVKREVHSNISLPRNKRNINIYINNITLHLKQQEKEKETPKLVEGRNNKNQSISK